MFNSSNLFIPRSLKKVKISAFVQNQFDAIVSFAFNIGVGSFKSQKGLLGSDFLRELNRGHYDGNLMLHYRHPPEIIGRRTDESVLFNVGVY
jgi:GH24 family phage-related lysozyme (muramidase)